MADLLPNDTAGQATYLGTLSSLVNGGNFNFVRFDSFGGPDVYDYFRFSHPDSLVAVTIRLTIPTVSPSANESIVVALTGVSGLPETGFSLAQAGGKYSGDYPTSVQSTNYSQDFTVTTGQDAIFRVYGFSRKETGEVVQAGVDFSYTLEVDIKSESPGGGGHAPVITSNGGGDIATVSVAENSIAVTIVTASDQDNDTLSYLISGGADQSKFQINASTGALSFITPPDFETPSSTTNSNSYVVQVGTTDGAGFSDNQLLTVNVTNVTEGAPIVGDGSNNTLTGTPGNETISGLGGNDTLSGGPGADLIDGGVGFDLASWLLEPNGLTLNLANQALNAGSAAGDTIVGVEAFYLTNSADSFTAGAAGIFVYGFAGNDTLTGGSQSDFIDGGPGADTIDAGGGFDYVSYNSSAAAVTLNLQTLASNTGDAAGDTIANAEAYILTEFNDTFVGRSNAQNIVFGYGGNDTLTGGLNTNNWIFGGDGNDRMVGGLWADLYSGGNGADTIVPVTPTPLAGSSVIGFEVGIDTIEISRAAFGLSAAYAVTSGSTFVSGTNPLAVTGSPTFYYYTNFGLLYFDHDGAGSMAAALLMQFDNAAPLTASNFHLV